MTIFASMVEFGFKPYLMMKKQQDKSDSKEDEDGSPSFDVTSKAGLLNFILVTATMELVIFFLEDCVVLSV
jgi:hypothetical protein